MTDADDDREGSNVAGATVLTVAGGGVGLAVFVYSRDAFVLLVWALGAAAVWWAAKRPNKIENPSPKGGVEAPRYVERQVGGPSVTEVGDSCRIVSHPDERRSYGLESRGGTDPGGA